jgi:Ca2+-binding RTX toxin-like protein
LGWRVQDKLATILAEAASNGGLDALKAEINLAFASDPGGIPFKSGTGSADNDILLGSEGNDTLSGKAGNDILIGGAGNDALDGGAGNDTYLFSRGDGKDTINQSDSAANRLDVVQLTDLISADLTLIRSGANLILNFGNGDSLTLSNFYQGDSYWQYKIDQIVFADGETWSREDIMAAATTLSENNDSVTASSLIGAHILGLAGNDTISGGSQADWLEGGVGDDTLRGYAGDDILIGGSGNDTLDGGAGNDTYLFSRGDGKDTINQNDSAANRLDTVQLTDLVSADMTLIRNGYNLILDFGGGDSITLSNFHLGDIYPQHKIDRIVFADGETWSLDEIMAAATALSENNDSMTASSLIGAHILGLAGNDAITGGSKADTFEGGNGDDTLSGKAGNDILIGGIGNDILQGGAGNDLYDGGAGNDTMTDASGNNTYLFGKGDGQDTIASYSDSTANKLNSLQFKADITLDDLIVKRSGNNLVFSFEDSADQVTVQNFFYNNTSGANAYNPIQQVTFDNGTVWALNDIVNHLSTV